MVSKKQKAWDEAEAMGLTEGLVYDDVTRSQLEEIIVAGKAKEEAEPAAADETPAESDEPAEQEAEEAEAEEEKAEEDDDDSEEESEEESEEDAEEEAEEEPADEPEEKAEEKEAVTTSERPAKDVKVVKRAPAPVRKKRILQRYFPKKSRALRKY